MEERCFVKKIAVNMHFVEVFYFSQRNSCWIHRIKIYSKGKAVLFRQLNVNWKVWKSNWIAELCHSVTFRFFSQNSVHPEIIKSHIQRPINTYIKINSYKVCACWNKKNVGQPVLFEFLNWSINYVYNLNVD